MLPTLRHHVIAIIILVLLAVLWGGLYVPTKYAVDHYSPLLFATLRLLPALIGLALPVLLHRRRRAHLTPATMRRGAVIGLFYGLGFLLQTYGLAGTEAGRGAFLVGLYVVLVPALDFLLFRARLGRIGMAAVGLAVAGLGLVGGPLGGLAFGAGDALCLLSGLCYAAHILAIARLGRGVDSMVLTCLQLAAVTPLVGAASLLVEGVPRLSGELVLLAVATGVAANVVGLLGMVWAQKHVPPTTAGVVLAGEPVYAAAGSWLWLGERFAVSQLAGMGLLLAAMLVMPLDRRRALTPESPAASAPWAADAPPP